MTGKRRITITVCGQPSYQRYTLHEWLREIKDLLEEEYGVELVIKTRDTPSEEPQLCIGNEPFLEGIPGEEGYLIEIMKKLLDIVLGEKVHGHEP